MEGITILVFCSDYRVDNDDNNSDDDALNENFLTKHSIKFPRYKKKNIKCLITFRCFIATAEKILLGNNVNFL